VIAILGTFYLGVMAGVFVMALVQINEGEE